MEAVPLAEAGKLVTFGILPTEPHTGYGYIETSVAVADAYEVSSFKEKPDADRAAQYVADGSYYWNSGMFLFKASTVLAELKAHRLDIDDACERTFSDVSSDLDFIRIDGEAFAECPEDSIDYAVMEKTKDAVVIPIDAGWNDIGSWSSLWGVAKKDDDGNSVVGDAILIDTKSSLVRTDDKLLAILGLEEVVVVPTKDSTIVASKDRVQDAKLIAFKLKTEDRNEWKLHREVYQPWGKYDSVDQDDRYQVKRITVNPGAKLSIQKHYHRAEHWAVVFGAALVTNNGKTFTLHENESTHIPISAIHALENPHDVPLEIVEIQSGSYLGEDYIVRLSDWYGRVDPEK